MLAHVHNTLDLELEAARLAREPELVTNAGRDAISAQIADTAAPPARFNYHGLTANSTAPAAGDTTLTGEITTAGGGLIRKQGAYAHTNGTATFTITTTFTANGSDALPVTVAKVGTFNASTAGTLGASSLLNATATFSAVGDATTITDTWTLTAS